MTAASQAASRAEAERKNTAHLILAITLLLVFLMAARSPLDSDLWWHLRAGEETLSSGRAVLVDTYSYTRQGSAWINHSWLGQAALALVYRAGGFPALSGLVALAAAACMGLVYAQMQSPALVRAFIVILAATVAAPVWSPRPQLFSLLLLAVTGCTLHLYRARQIDRLLWLLLPLFVLWSNLHGGYPLGLMLVGAAVGGEALNHLLRGDSQTGLSWQQTGKLALVGVGAFLATAINPNGIQMWLIPFKTVNVGVLQALIQEWASPDFHDPAQQPMLALLFATVAAMGLAGKRRDGFDLAALVIFGGLALIARRNFGPFALVCAPVLSRAVMDCAAAPGPRIAGSRPALRIASYLRRAEGQASSPKAAMFKRITNLAIVGLLGFAAAGKLYAVTHPALLEQQLDAGYPVAAAAWLRDNRPQGRLFNAYNWGGYLLWSLPEYAVFVDGRTDLFGDEILSEWITVVGAGEGWQRVLEKWDVRLILLEPDRPVNALLPLEGWKLLLAGKGFVLYGR